MNDAREGEGFLEAEPVQAARTVVALDRCHDDDVVVVGCCFCWCSFYGWVVDVVELYILLLNVYCRLPNKTAWLA